MGELDDSFGELDQLASPPTCFHRKISTKTPIETKLKAFRSKFNWERKGGDLGVWFNCPTRQMGELDGSFRELDQLASRPTCFYRKISSETSIEMKQKAFRSEFTRESIGGAIGGWFNCPTRPFSELDSSNSPNGRVGRCIRSNSPNRGAGWFARSNLSFGGTSMRSFRKCCQFYSTKVLS